MGQQLLLHEPSKGGGDVARTQGRMEYELKAQLNDYRDQHRGFQFELLETYQYYPNTDPEQFVRRLEEQRKH